MDHSPNSKKRSFVTLPQKMMSNELTSLTHIYIHISHIPVVAASGPCKDEFFIEYSGMLYYSIAMLLTVSQVTGELVNCVKFHSNPKRQALSTKGRTCQVCQAMECSLPTLDVPAVLNGNISQALDRRFRSGSMELMQWESAETVAVAYCEFEWFHSRYSTWVSKFGKTAKRK